MTICGARSFPGVYAQGYECLKDGGESEVTDAPEQMQDRPKDQLEELIEVNLVKQGNEARLILISPSLSNSINQALLDL